jgi:hypothetical protein
LIFKTLTHINNTFSHRSGFQISRKATIQHDRTENFKVFTETGVNEPSMDEVVKESTSFLVAEESKQLSFTSPGHYKITPLHREDMDFERNIPNEATLSFVHDISQGTEHGEILN